MHRIAIRLLALALFCASAAPPAVAETIKPETIKIGLLKTSSSAVAMIAIKRGYFTAAGLDVQLVPRQRRRGPQDRYAESGRRAALHRP